MKKFLLLFILLFSASGLFAQTVYPAMDENTGISNIPSGVFCEGGPMGSDQLNWTYPYGTKLTVNAGGDYRNFQICTTDHPSGQLEFREFNNNISQWGPWRNIVMADDNGRFGINTGSPNNTLQVALNKGEGIDIGKPSDSMSYPHNVAKGGDIGFYSLRFYGWRDLTPNQVDAKIAAVRINTFQDNNEAVQGMDLAFYTGDGWGEANSNFQDLSVERMRIKYNGNILIGKSTQTNISYKLDVNGDVRANKLVVNTTGADYVFNKDYELPSLDSLKLFIKNNHHLPEIAPAEKMQKAGMDVGGNETKLLQKIEELTLYIIKQNEQPKKELDLNSLQNKRLAAQDITLAKLRKDIRNLKARLK